MKSVKNVILYLAILGFLIMLASPYWHMEAKGELNGFQKFWIIAGIVVISAALYSFFKFIGDNEWKK